MKKILGLLVLALFIVTGCSNGNLVGTDDDLKVASTAVQEAFNSEDGVTLESDVLMSFSIAKEKVAATSKVIINIIDGDHLVMKLPHGIDFGTLPVGQLGLENLNKEMIYVIDKDVHTLFIEGEISEQEKLMVDLDNMIDMAIGDQHFENLKDNIKNFVVTKNGDETVYTYEVVDDSFFDTMSNQLKEANDITISRDDVQILTTQSIIVLNGNVTFINTTNTLMMDAGLLIGPEAGTLGNMTVDLITQTDLRSDTLIEVPEIPVKEKSLD